MMVLIGCVNSNNIVILIGGITQYISTIGFEAYKKFMTRKIVDVKILNELNKSKHIYGI